MTQPSSETSTFELLNDEEVQQRHANQFAVQVFNGDANAEQISTLITQFVSSYEKHRHEMPLNEWLAAEFRRYPSIGKDDAEIESTAREIIASVQSANAAKTSLYAHLDKGKSRESWLANQIETGAKIAGVTQVIEYAKQLDSAITNANKEFDRTVFTQTGLINQNLQLHGLIAESEIANQFNLNAQASQSDIHATVLHSTALNSHDIVLHDGVGNIIQNVQVKSYSDVDQLIKNVADHQYQQGTTLLVHEDQVGRMQREFPDLNVTSKLEVGTVGVEMPSREEFRQLQENAQFHNEIRHYEWNDVNRIDIAKGIGEQILLGASVVAGIQGIRILGRRIWNATSGKENPPVSEDIKEFFTSSIKSGTHIGIQIAISGAIMVAARNGWLGALLENTPAFYIASMVYIGIENAKLLFKFSSGELSGPETLDAMGNISCSAIGGLAGAGYGMTQGVAIGLIFGPIGATIGGVVGSIIGGLAGRAIGDAIYAGGEAIIKTAVSVVNSITEGIKNVVRSIARIFNPLILF
ncbi:hypothetical protein CKO12_02020 [Chromatium okenii]|uniref:hypothetical protein n=1 Tax=Chromatium okenii TaxID=61644 RepID=UPI0019059089|nr:hypothetical protein [Chromatium okenii]MBK1640674.1 hypothetical protein [Chromatium okenii]